MEGARRGGDQQPGAGRQGTEHREGGGASARPAPLSTPPPRAGCKAPRSSTTPRSDRRAATATQRPLPHGGCSGDGSCGRGQRSAEEAPTRYAGGQQRGPRDATLGPDRPVEHPETGCVHRREGPAPPPSGRAHAAATTAAAASGVCEREQQGGGGMAQRGVAEGVALSPATPPSVATEMCTVSRRPGEERGTRPSLVSDGCAVGPRRAIRLGITPPLPLTRACDRRSVEGDMQRIRYISGYSM